jgi:AraC-like DNA-binding protein
MAYEERTVGGAGLVLWRSTAAASTTAASSTTSATTTTSATSTLVTPDGVLDLMVFRSRLVLAGPDTEAQRVDFVPGETTWGLRLPPGVAHAMLDTPVDELVDQRIELSDLTRVAPAWVDLSADRPWAALVQVYTDLWKQRDPDPDVLRRAGVIDRSARQRTPLPVLADDLGISERTLRRFTHQVFGYGVKTLSGIHRLQRALAYGRAGHRWSDAAAQAGYADHAHLIRDCRRYTQMVPSELATA